MGSVGLNYNFSRMSRFSVFIFFCITSVQIQAQRIENVRFEQSGKQINIYYDLVALKPVQHFDVRAYYSINGGNTLIGPILEVTGDVGKGQSAGRYKKITWDVLREREKLVGDVIFEIRALPDGGVDEIEFGPVQKAVLGVTIIELTAELAREINIDHFEGVFVTRLLENGAAKAAGIERGDVITSINGIPVKTPSEVLEEMSRYRPNDKISVTLVRNTSELQMSVVLGNLEDGTGIVSKDQYITVFGASFNEVSVADLKKLGISGGVKVTEVRAGKFRSVGIREDFIITQINNKKIESIDNLMKIIESADGGVYIEGIYPDGLIAYYALRINASHTGGTADGTFTDRRDERIYKYVIIGDQVWMAENLAYLPDVSPPDIGSGLSPYYYVYDYKGRSVSAAKATDNYREYAVLYNWPAAREGACPDGWHLPSDAEWTELINYLGGSSVAGGKMKETGMVHWDSPNTGATNSSGFSALPGGFRNNDGNFSSVGGYATFWSSTRTSISYAWYRELYYTDSEVGHSGHYEYYGFSVRCLRDL